MLVEFNLPELGENIDSGDVVKIMVTAGDAVQMDQPLLELETDKAVVEVPSPVSGRVKEIHVQEGGKAHVGQLVMTFEAEKGADAPPPKPAKPEPVPSKPPEPVKAEPSPPPQEESKPSAKPAGRSGPAAPSVRKLAREIGVDLNTVPGSGPGGRITVEDVKAYARAANTQWSGVSIDDKPLPEFTKWGEVERKPMSNVRRTTAEHLSIAWRTAPHVTQFDKADVTDLEELRHRYSKKAEDMGGKLTTTAILMKIVASALRLFPQLNAAVDMPRTEIVYKKYIHIGIAVDTDRGLLVPVIRDVDKKNILELSVELTQAAQRARERKTPLEELQGGTFSISNLGGIGGTAFTPIVNSPEVAILGVSRTAIEPVWREDRFVPRKMMPLSLSYDHRLVDGADAIRFLRWVVEALEQPFMISLEG